MIETSRLLQSIPGIRHGFSLRKGGCSSGPYASLNLGYNTDDKPENIEENLQRLAKQAALGHSFIEVNQVHGNNVIIAEEKLSRKIDADGILSKKPGQALAVRTADCTPLLMVHYNKVKQSADLVAAVHAGWRGAVAQIPIVALNRFLELGANRENIYFGLGPCIGYEHFEVGSEVIEAAQACLLEHPVPYEAKGEGKFHLNLRELIRLQLIEASISAEAIDLVGGCTFSQPEYYFSYRRDRGITGRHLSFILLE